MFVDLSDYNENSSCPLQEIIEEFRNLSNDINSENNTLIEQNYTKKEIKTKNQETIQNDNFNFHVNSNKPSKIKILIDKEIKSNSKTFITKKRGRRPKSTKDTTQEISKSIKRSGNACYKIYNSCIYNTHYFIKKICKGLDVDKPTTSNNHKKSHDAMRELFNKTVYELYCDNIMTKRFKEDLKIKHEDKKKQIEMKQEKYRELNKNKKAIDYFLKNNNQEKDKDKETLFKEIKFKDFLIAYLNNYRIICKRDENGNFIFRLPLTGFETYEQFFNGEYTQKEKEKFKNHIFDIMMKKSRDRIRGKNEL